MNGIGNVPANVINVPMETISDSAVKMHCYELYDYQWENTMAKRIKTDDKSNTHPKSLEHISQGPDRKRA